MSVFSIFTAIFIIGSAHGTTDVDTAWMKATIRNYFSQPRNHVSGPTYKDQAKNFILKQFTEYGLETHTHTFSTGISTVQGNNVIGVSKGKYFGTHQDRVVGVAAHYDTAQNTPGVDSNGAGVAGMLQAAKHLAKIPRDFTVMFVAFDFLLNEDRACANLGCGSESFMNEWVNSYWSTPPTTTGVIVMDTIMNFNVSQESQNLPAGFNLLFPNVVSSITSNNNKGDFLAVVGRPFDRDVLNKFIQAYTALGLTEFGVENIYISSLTTSAVTVNDMATYSDLMRSDHRTFWSRGIPAIFLTDTADFRGYMKTCFHNSCDDMSRVTDKMIQFAGKTTQAVIDTVKKLAPKSRAGSAHGTTDVDTAWMKATIRNYFSQPRNHVSGPTYKDQAKNFILKQFTEYGLETHTHTFSTGISTVQGNNVIGVSKGKYFGTHQDRVVGVAAHYDTAQNTPGVDSNGAGVAGMLQAAKHLAKIPRDFTVMFVAFDFLLNEDRACANLGCGSESFMNEWVNSYWSTPPTTTGVIVMDTIMNFNVSQESQSLPAGFNLLFPNVVSSITSNNNKGDFLAVVGRPFDRDVLNKFIQAYTALGLTEFGVENIYISSLTTSAVTVNDMATYSDLMRSDHRTFWSRGIPAIFLTDTADFRGYMKTCFHNSCDDMSRVTDKMIQFAGKTTQAVIDTVKKLAPKSRAGSAHGTTDVDTAWMKATLRNYFSQPRNHVSGPTYKDQAKNFILKQFTEYGLETHTHTFSTGISTVQGNNVIGVSKGKYFGTHQDRVVGVAAHYDTAQNTPGVDSNGAGVAGMLQAAKHLAKIPRDFTVMFVAFDFLLNEDRACANLGCGSESFMNEWVNSYWSTPPTTTGVIVMDTIMNFNVSQESQSLPAGFNLLFPNVVSSITSNNNKGDFLAVVGRPFDRDVLNKFIQAYTALGLTEFGVENIYISSLTTSAVTVNDMATYSDLMRSDHRTFWSRGIPAIFLTDTADFRGYMKTCFHNSCDDMSRVTDKMIQFAGKTTQAVIDTVKKLAPKSRAGVNRVDVPLLGLLGTLLWINAAFSV